MLCPVCKQEIEDGSLFCPICGAKLDDVAEEANDVAEDAGDAVEDAGEEVSEAAEDVAEDAGDAVEDAGEEVAEAIEDVAEDAGDAVEAAEEAGEQVAEEEFAWSEDLEKELEPADEDSEVAEGEEGLEGDVVLGEDGEPIEQPKKKEKKKGRWKTVLAIIAAIILCCDTCLICYGVFFNEGKLPDVNMKAKIASLKYAFGNDDDLYIENQELDITGVEANATTASGYTADAFGFYIDPWIDAWFKGDMAEIEKYDETFNGQGVNISYLFDEAAYSALFGKVGDYVETSTDYRIKEKDSVLTIIKTAKGSKGEVAFVFEYNMMQQTIRWEVGLEKRKVR